MNKFGQKSFILFWSQGCDSGSNPNFRRPEGLKFLTKTAQAVVLAVAELAGGLDACDLSKFYHEYDASDVDGVDGDAEEEKLENVSDKMVEKSQEHLFENSNKSSTDLSNNLFGGFVNELEEANSAQDEPEQKFDNVSNNKVEKLSNIMVEQVKNQGLVSSEGTSGDSSFDQFAQDEMNNFVPLKTTLKSAFKTSLKTSPKVTGVGQNSNAALQHLVTSYLRKLPRSFWNSFGAGISGNDDNDVRNDDVDDDEEEEEEQVLKEFGRETEVGHKDSNIWMRNRIMSLR